jgi:hypothetical protein
MQKSAKSLFISYYLCTVKGFRQVRCVSSVIFENLPLKFDFSMAGACYYGEECLYLQHIAN